MKASKFKAEPTLESGSTSTATLALIGKKEWVHVCGQIQQKA